VIKQDSLDLCVLVGSIRADSYSLKISHLIAGIAAASNHSCKVIDPRELKLGIPHHPDDQGQSVGNSAMLQALIKNAKTIVIVTPEYDGSYSAVTKVLIEHLGYPSALAGKFISIIGVASGRIGADRAIEHLRGVLLHIGGIILPNHLSIAEVHKSFSEGGGADRSFMNKLETLTARLLKTQSVN
jgi:chromate reductase